MASELPVKQNAYKWGFVASVCTEKTAASSCCLLLWLATTYFAVCSMHTQLPQMSRPVIVTKLVEKAGWKQIWETSSNSSRDSLLFFWQDGLLQNTAPGLQDLSLTVNLRGIAPRSHSIARLTCDQSSDRAKWLDHWRGCFRQALTARGGALASTDLNKGSEKTSVLLGTPLPSMAQSLRGKNGRRLMYSGKKEASMHGKKHKRGREAQIEPGSSHNNNNNNNYSQGVLWMTCPLKAHWKSVFRY